MRSNRIDNMMSYIKARKTVTLDNLCEEFQVSKNTIRRDVSELLSTGEFKKIYGGITVATTPALKPFSERNIKNQELKQDVAKKAASLVNDGDIIFIDSGTTTFNMIEYLKDKQNITILTNNLEAIIHAIPYPDMKIVSLSGNLDHKTLSFTGTSASEILSNYNISKSFLASTGISIEGEITNSSSLEYEVKRVAVSRSQSNYVLVDHTKFNVVSLLTFTNFSTIDYLITDEMPPEDLKKYIESCNTKIVLSDK
jgi:DeoR family myo-inositol catabolism operon transcriptional repressor